VTINVRTPVAAPTQISQATAIEQARAVAEVMAAVTVAQQCPRDMGRAWAEMRASCGRMALASRAFYAVPNRGTGPSVHLARELARIWGNLDSGVRELRRDDDAHESEIQAYAWDQQTNVRTSRSFIHPHARMKGRDRQPLTDLTDIYLSNQNVGARAVRECLFAAMPADFVAEAQELCRATIEKGDGKPLDRRIADMVAAFGGIGVTAAQIETRLGRGKGQWTASDLADLLVVFSSIKRAETTADDEFPPERVTAAEIQGAAQAAPAPLTSPPAPSGTRGDQQAPGSNVAAQGQAEQLPVEDPPAMPWPDTAQPPDAPKRGRS
jgi:hypothetical protein